MCDVLWAVGAFANLYACMHFRLAAELKKNNKMLSIIVLNYGFECSQRIAGRCVTLYTRRMKNDIDANCYYRQSNL